MSSATSSPGSGPVLGLDVGGVIVDRAAHGSDTSFFGTDPMATPAVPGSFDAIASLVDAFAGRAVIVSKAGPRISALTRAWLVHTGFHDRTGLRVEDVHFVRDRADKAPICADLAVTHFVDDRPDVLRHLRGIVDHRYLFLGGLGSAKIPTRPDRDVVVAGDWSTASTLVLATLAGDGLAGS